MVKREGLVDKLLRRPGKWGSGGGVGDVAFLEVARDERGGALA